METRVHSILHITEAFASGTLEAMRRIVSAQTAEGAVVSVLHGVRPDSPSESQWGGLFPPTVCRSRVRPRNRLLALWSMGTSARRALRQDQAVIVHVHSTYAAAVVRLFLAFQNANRRIVYSPHGFAFLRQDLPRPARKALLLIERFLSRQCGGLMLVSESEAQLVRKWVSPDRITVVENAVNLDEMPVTIAENDRECDGLNPIVVTMGRVTYQKAPWKFAELARTFGDVASFVWIGDGTPSNRDRWLSGSPVHVTGWLAKEELVAQLGAASLFVLPSLWEGMPLALIEAQCLGLPAVVSSIVGNKDVVVHNQTGFLADDDSELFEYVKTLILDSSLRRAMGDRALEQRERFGHERLGKETISIYERLLK